MGLQSPKCLADQVFIWACTALTTLNAFLTLMCEISLWPARGQKLRFLVVSHRLLCALPDLNKEGLTFSEVFLIVAVDIPVS